MLVQAMSSCYEPKRGHPQPKRSHRKRHFLGTRPLAGDNKAQGSMLEPVAHKTRHPENHSNIFFASDKNPLTLVFFSIN